MSIKFVAMKQVPLDQLTTFPGNAWKPGQVELIRESLREHGQFRAILVRSVKGGPDVVLAGNHTYRAMVEENMGAVRCEVITCSDEDALKLNLADNRYEQIGERDKAELAELVAQLEGDYTGTGYTEDSVTSLLALLEGEEQASGAHYDEELGEDSGRPEADDVLSGDQDAPGSWGVVVMCESETQQAELLQRLSGEGHTVRALIS
jgi:ParB-like chromosome segregation protein Spo0J